MYPFTRMVIDADLWCYDIAFAAQGKDGLMPFSWVAGVIDTRLKELKENLCCEEFTMYLTGTGNFRSSIATRDTYKANRGERPRYYQPIRDYLVLQYGAIIVDGMEADDALSIELTSYGESVICVSRDKDLRQVPGWHYSYRVGKTPEFGPKYYDELGELELIKKKTYTLKGGGLRFFYSQVLTGDTTDNYKGAKGAGPVSAYKSLNDCDSHESLLREVLGIYWERYAEDGLKEFLEQANLAWMVRELYEDKTPVLFSTKFSYTIDQIWYSIQEEFNG